MDDISPVRTFGVPGDEPDDQEAALGNITNAFMPDSYQSPKAQHWEHNYSKAIQKYGVASNGSPVRNVQREQSAESQNKLLRAPVKAN